MMNLQPTSSSIEKIEFPKEFKDMAALLEFIQNKDKVTELFNKIDIHASKANALIEKVGKAEKIGSLYEEAKARVEKTTELMEVAEEKAANILRQSEEKSTALLSNAESQAEKLLTEAETIRAQAIQDAQQAKEDRKAAELAAKESQERLAQIQAKESRLDKLQEEIERKKALLAQL